MVKNINICSLILNLFLEISKLIAILNIMKTSYLKPLIALRDIVIFPSMVVPLFVGREKSIKALQEVMKPDKSIVLVTQKNSEVDDPNSKDLYQYGCLSKVLQLLKLPDGTVKVLVEGEKRVKILKHNESSKEIF